MLNKKGEINLSRKGAFVSLGCKVNQYETNAMEEKFIQEGYIITIKATINKYCF